MLEKLKISLDWYFCEVVKTIAKRLNISNWEWKTHKELCSEIEEMSESLFSTLNDFFDIYRRNQDSQEGYFDSTSSYQACIKIREELIVKVDELTRHDSK